MNQDEINCRRLRYESRGSQLARQQQSNREKPRQLPPGAVFVEDTKTANKKKEKKPDEKAQAPVNMLSKMMAEIKVTNKISGEDFEADQKNKQIRKLKKTLREIEQLEEKMQSGQLPNPEKEQLEKLKRKEAILQEIQELES